LPLFDMLNIRLTKKKEKEIIKYVYLITKRC
jgi:hypothetical protein